MRLLGVIRQAYDSEKVIDMVRIHEEPPHGYSSIGRARGFEPLHFSGSSPDTRANERKNKMSVGCECYIGGSYIPGHCPACLERAELEAEHEEETDILNERIREFEARIEELENKVSYLQGLVSDMGYE